MQTCRTGKLTGPRTGSPAGDLALSGARPALCLRGYCDLPVSADAKGVPGWALQDVARTADAPRPTLMALARGLGPE
jgi:hypothetical protein